MENSPVTLPGSLPIGPLSSLKDLARKARSLPTRIVVIAAAQDDVALEAAAVAEEEELLAMLDRWLAILVGLFVKRQRRYPKKFQQDP